MPHELPNANYERPLPLEEVRAIAEQERADLASQEPAPLEESMWWVGKLLERLGYPQILLEEGDVGACDDCRQEHPLVHLGNVHVCRAHALWRLRTAARVEDGSLNLEPAAAGDPPRPRDLDDWIARAHIRLPLKTIGYWLGHWHIDGDERIRLLEKAADLQKQLAHGHTATEAA